MLLLLLLVLLVSSASPQTIFTANYGLNRTNANTQEGLLSPANVNPARFGKLFALPVDGAVYAQPLFVPKLSFSDGLHNVVYIATMHNSVFAFDADSGTLLWRKDLGPAVPAGDYTSRDILVEVGILSTPVIDPAAGTLYAVANTKTFGEYSFALHALDLITGVEKCNGPVAIQATVPGSVDSIFSPTTTFHPFDHLQRPALLLSNGTVYVSFGSHADGGVWHGWILGYSAGDVRDQTHAFSTTPDGYGGAVWQSGRGPAVDADGFLYVATGNGDRDTHTNFGESLVKLDPANALQAVDSFTPSKWLDLNKTDTDFGSAGPVLIPNSSLVIAGDKAGTVYLVDRNNLGGVEDGDTQIVQKFPAVSFGIFNMAFWESEDVSYLYVRAFNDAVKAFRFADGRFQTTPAMTALDSHRYSVRWNDGIFRRRGSCLRDPVDHHD